MAARPVRLQLSRRKGFDLQRLSREINGLGAVSVARPHRWGNHPAKRLGITQNDLGKKAFAEWVETEASEEWKTRAARELRGKNLACFCKPELACHADILLELANSTEQLALT